MPKSLTARVLLAVALGALLGALLPQQAIYLKLCSDIFVRLVRMVVTPIVFLTIVVGVANMGDLKRVGRLGAKALLYFEVLTTLALLIGLLVAKLVQPGRAMDSAVVAARQTAPAAVLAAHAPLGFAWAPLHAARCCRCCCLPCSLAPPWRAKRPPAAPCWPPSSG